MSDIIQPSKGIVLVNDPYLVAPAHRKVSNFVFLPGRTVREITMEARAELSGLGFSEYVISVNGYRCSDIDQLLYDGDQVAITVKHGFEAVEAVIWVALYEAGMYAAINTVAWVLTAAVFIGGGLLVTSIMSPGNNTQSQNSGDTKPTYGWNGMTNETNPGNPIPVAYGRPYSAPQIIGSYRQVEGYTMWQYILLCASAGKTNNILTADDILIGTESLTAWTDYKFGATDGSPQITDATRTALADFDKIHHDRPFDKRLIHSDLSDVSLVTLLHFDLPLWSLTTGMQQGDFVLPVATNGFCYECTVAGQTALTEPAWPIIVGNTVVDGGVTWTCRAYSTTSVVDTSDRGVPNWTEHGTAQIKFDTPKFGSGYLSLSGTDYISTSDIEALRFDVPGQFDFYFRLPDLSDRVLWGKQVQHAGGPSDLQHSILSFGYAGGSFFLQNFYGFGPTFADVTDWTTTVDMSQANTPTIGTWYYVRIQSYYDDGQDAMAYQVLLQSGNTLVQLMTNISGYVFNPDPGSDHQVLQYSAETDAQKSNYAQQIGMGYHLDATTQIVTQLYAHCDLDEFRICRGIADDHKDRTLPSQAFANPDVTDNLFIIQTKSKCDSVRILIEFTQGLWQTDSSGVTSKSVQFSLDYRETGTTGAWITSTVTSTAAMTSAPRFHYELDFPKRALYDVRIERLTPEDGNSNTVKSLSYLISFEEIIDLFLGYPGLQIIALGVKASDTRSGQIGTITVRHNKTMIDVPSWDGLSTQSVAADIPAYQMMDAFTNPHYGMVESVLNLPQEEWEAWRDWTEGIIDDNRRAPSNIVFDELATFSDSAITYIEQVGRARLIRSGPNWIPLIDQPRPSQYTFSAGNISPNTFEWSSYEETEKTDAVEITFWNADQQGQKDTRMAKASWYDALDRVPQIAQVEIRGIIYPEQALREARFRINKNEYLTRHGKHRCLIGGAMVELGEVCNIIPPSCRSVYGGRLLVDHEKTNVITIDENITLSSADTGKFKIFIVNPTGDREGDDITEDGYEQEFSILGPWDVATNEFAIDGVYTGNRWDVFGIGRLVEDKLLNQITKKTINAKEQNVDLEWCQYDERIFFDPAYGAGIVPI